MATVAGSLAESIEQEDERKRKAVSIRRISEFVPVVRSFCLKVYKFSLQDVRVWICRVANYQDYRFWSRVFSL